MKLREAIVGLVVGALAIAIFLGAIFAMGGGSPSAGEGAPPAAQPTPASQPDEDLGAGA